VEREVIQLECKVSPTILTASPRLNATCSGCGTPRLHENHLPEGVQLDRDGDPYRIDGVIGPWKVSHCCFAYAKGLENGVVCRACYHDFDYIDAPANVPAREDRFGRTRP
jgi:hypothetical protein